MKISRPLDTAFTLLLCILFLVLARIGVMDSKLTSFLVIGMFLIEVISIVIFGKWSE